jgi:prepilin-type N-terminal cleavage/methylation domain-containing protein
MSKYTRYKAARFPGMVMTKPVEGKLDLESGYTLIELIVTIAVIGLVAYSFSIMETGILSATAEDDLLSRAAHLAECKMEESIRTGVLVPAVDWTDADPFEWRRTVQVLKVTSTQPTLVEVEIQVRKGSAIVCSLTTHLAE